MQRTYKLSEIAPTRAEGAMAALLAAAGRRRRFKGGATIQQRGESVAGFWLIAAGQVMVCRFGRDGVMTVFGVLGPGDLFGELAYFGGVPRQVDVVAESDAELVRIDSALIDRFLATEPDFSRWLLKSLANQLRFALDRIESDRRLPAEARMARVLAEMAARDGKDVAMTQQQLADFVGVSRVTAGHVLAKFAAAGLVKQRYGRICVANATALAARAAR